MKKRIFEKILKRKQLKEEEEIIKHLSQDPEDANIYIEIQDDEDEDENSGYLYTGTP